MASSATPKLIIPEDKSTTETNAQSSCKPPFVSPSSETGTKKLSKILSTQSSFDRQHPPYPVKKRFSIDADPSSILLNLPPSPLSLSSVVDFTHPPSTPDPDDNSSSTQIPGKELSPVRSPLLKKSDSFLGIPYEKGEIVDLIKLVDDPNSAAHLTNNGNEVLLEHSAASL